MSNIIVVTGPEVERDTPVWFITVRDRETGEDFVFWKRPNYWRAMSKAFDHAKKSGLKIEMG